MRKTSRQCSVCHEKIEATAENFIQDISCDAIRDIKTHIHYRAHGKQFLTNKGIIKRISWVGLMYLICIILCPIWIITWPFWKIHELISS